MGRKTKPLNALSIYKESEGKRYTYAEMARHIKEQTGESFTPNYLTDVGAGRCKLSPRLLDYLRQTYPDFDQVIG